MSVDGRGPKGTAEKNLGEIVAEVSEKASLLVRQEVALARPRSPTRSRSSARGPPWRPRPAFSSSSR
jgi:hypothetical protein